MQVHLETRIRHQVSVPSALRFLKSFLFPCECGFIAVPEYVCRSEDNMHESVLPLPCGSQGLNSGPGLGRESICPRRPSTSWLGRSLSVIWRVPGLLQSPPLQRWGKTVHCPFWVLYGSESSDRRLPPSTVSTYWRSLSPNLRVAFITQERLSWWAPWSTSEFLVLRIMSGDNLACHITQGAKREQTAAISPLSSRCQDNNEKWSTRRKTFFFFKALNIRGNRFRVNLGATFL